AISTVVPARNPRAAGPTGAGGAAPQGEGSYGA
ncbi:MAG: RNA-binding protein hfq, partial [Alcanivoracaceae bacterium]